MELPKMPRVSDGCKLFVSLLFVAAVCISNDLNLLGFYLLVFAAIPIYHAMRKGGFYLYWFNSKGLVLIRHFKRTFIDFSEMKVIGTHRYRYDCNLMVVQVDDLFILHYFNGWQKVDDRLKNFFRCEKATKKDLACASNVDPLGLKKE